MSREQSLREKLQRHFLPLFLEVTNESHLHSRGMDSHFKVLLVSAEFEGQTRVERSRRVHQVLSEDFQQIHSITTPLLAPTEWDPKDAAQFQSPRCQGKG